MLNEQRESLRDLWSRACAPADDPARRALPPRCDRKWFEDVFCAGGTVKDVENVWDSVAYLNVYTGLALVCALPEYLDHHFRCFSIRLRAATHHVVGLTAEEDGLVIDQHYLRHFLCEAFLNGSLSNQSTNWDKPTISVLDSIPLSAQRPVAPEGRVGFLLKKKRWGDVKNKLAPREESNAGQRVKALVGKAELQARHAEIERAAADATGASEAKDHGSASG